HGVVCCLSLVVFFFSSRRRHTRCYRDWSSDVCSSDLSSLVILIAISQDLRAKMKTRSETKEDGVKSFRLFVRSIRALANLKLARSEERRVGKEGTTRV